MEQEERRGARALLIQRFSDSWEMKFGAQIWSHQRYGGVVIPSAESWQTDTITYAARQNNEFHACATVQDDFNGKYVLGTLKNVSAFGFNHTDLTDTSEFWTSATPNTFTIPMGSASAIESIVVPQQAAGDYPVPANPGSCVKTHRDNLYYQHQLDIIPDRLSLVAGWTLAHIESVNDTNIAYNAPASTTDETNTAWLYRYGIVAHLAKDVSLYGLESTTFTPNVGTNYYNQLLPNVQGEGDEIGIKTALWEGRLTSTIAAFRQRLTNQTVIGTGLNAAGAGYFVPIGSTTTHGWDAELALGLLPGWQVIATAFDGTTVNQTDTPVSSTYDNSWSLFTRYDFRRDSPLRGLATGGGVSRIGGRWLSTSGETFPAGWAKPSVFKVQEGTSVSVFVIYRLARHWIARVSASNLLDQRYLAGAQSAGAVDPAPPRTVTLSLTLAL